MKGKSQKQTATTTQMYTPEDLAAKKAIAAGASDVYNQTKTAIANSPYIGAAPVDPSAQTLQGQQTMMQNADAAQQSVNNIPGALQYGLHDAMDVNNNPYLQKAVDAATGQITKSYTDPGGVFSVIRGNAMANGGQGQNSRQGIAEGIGLGRYSQAVGDTASKMYSDAYNQGQDTFARTLGLLPSAVGALSTPGAMQSAVGSQVDQQQAAENQYLADSRAWDLNKNWIPLQNYANIMYPGMAPMGTTTTQGGGNKKSGLMGAIGGAATAFGAGAGPIGTAVGGILGGLFG